MPTGNDNVSEHNTLRVRSDLGKKNMTAEEISPSIRERNRRPDKQLYVPKARRLSIGKEKEKCVANDALPPANEPRKVLSSVQHKQTEGSSSISPRNMKEPPKEKRSSKLPSRPASLNNCVKAKPLAMPISATDLADVLAAGEKTTKNDQVVVQRSSAGIGHSADLTSVEARINRRKKMDKVTKNSQVLPSVQTPRLKSNKMKPASNLDVVSNHFESDISSAAVECACPIEIDKLCNSAVINTLDVLSRHPVSSSTPMKHLESVEETLLNHSIDQPSSRETLNVEFVSKTNIIEIPVHEDYISRKDNDRDQCFQAEKEFHSEKVDISQEDGVIEEDCHKSLEETSLANATPNIPLEYIGGNDTTSLVAQESQECDNELTEIDEQQPEDTFFDARDEITAKDEINNEISLQSITELRLFDGSVHKKEILPSEIVENQSEIEICSKEVETATVVSVSGPEITLTSAKEEFAAMDNAFLSSLGESNLETEVVTIRDSSPLRTFVRADCTPSVTSKNTTFSSCDESFSNEDSWDKLYDDSGECLDPSLKAQLKSTVGNVSIDVPQIDYLSFEVKEPQITDQEFGHVLEIYNFPVEFKTEDLISSFSFFKSDGFNIVWVDDTHALAAFSGSTAAKKALALQHPIISTRPLSQGIRESKLKARRYPELLLPHKKRPETSTSLAHRLVVSALGLKAPVPKQKQEDQKKQLREAKERKRLAAKQREEAWEGTAGNVD